MLNDLYRDSDNKFEYKLTLCKPNKTPIVELSEATNITYNAKFKDIDELHFRISRKTKSPINHRIETNPNFDLVKGDFLILCESNNESKYFTIQNPSSTSENSVYKDVTCFAYEIGLSKKYLRLFKGTRQIYTPKIYYSFDNVTWAEYKEPIKDTTHTTIYAKTREHNNVVEIAANTNIAVKTVVINGVGFSIVEKGEGTDKYKEITISTAGEIGIGILNRFEDEQNTWKIGYIDPKVYRDTLQEHNKYRTFDIAEKSWLDMIRNEIEPAYDCICLFDSVNNLINVYHIDTLSEDKGLFISEENFLKSIKQDMKFSEIYTRLKVYGNEGVSINTYNPSGLDSIDDFSYYKENGYMSDDLVTALNTYNALLDSKKGVFSGYLTQIKEQQDLLGQRQLELAQLQSELIIILDNIDLAIQSGADLTTLNQQKANKQAQVDSKKAEIDVVNAEITSIQGSVEVLRNEVDMNNNFTQGQLEELDYFIKEKTWQDETISNVEELYEEAKKAIKIINTPTIEYDTDIVNLFNLIECQYEWDKVKLGTIITLYSEQLGIDTQVRIVDIDHSDSGLKLTLSNKEEKTDYVRHLSDGLGRSNNTSTYVQYNKDVWNKTEGQGAWIQEIVESGLNSAKYQVTSGKNQTIKFDERGGTFGSLDNPGIIRILNNIIALSEDGEKFDLCIEPSGIIAKKLIGQILLSTKLLIANEANNVSIDKDGIIIKNDSGQTIITPNQINASAVTTGTLDANLVNVKNLSANSINSGSINANLVNLSNLNADNITTGTIKVGGHWITANGDIFLDSNGLYNNYGGTNNTLKSMVYTGWGGIDNPAGNPGITITLPSRFRGRHFDVAVMQTGVTFYSDSMTKIYLDLADEPNYTNGTFTVYAPSSSSNVSHITFTYIVVA